MSIVEIWGYVAAGIAVITAIVSLIKAVKYLLGPWSNMKSRIEQLELHDQRDIEKFDGIFAKMKSHEDDANAKFDTIINQNTSEANEMSKVQETLNQLNRTIERQNEELTRMSNSVDFIFQTLYAVVNHEIDGNGIAHLKEIRDKLNEFIIKR